MKPSSILHPPSSLIFTHAGQSYTLYKHPRELARHRAGQLTDDALRACSWYLRLTINGKRTPFRLSAHDKQAVVDARDKINGAQKQPAAFADWLAEREARRGVTIGALAADWIAAGLPHSKTNPRPSAAAERLQATLERALPWWKDIPATSAADHFENFAAARIGNTRSGDGRRTVDLQLASLSSLCQWAVLTQRLEENPFETRPHYVKEDQIQHCCTAMPDDDNQLHAILRWLWRDTSDPTNIIAGGALAFGALTGLRPGEPVLLQHLPAATTLPANLKHSPFGLIYPLPDGSRRMKVKRLKRGQNPAILVTPTLAEFLNAWTGWLTLQTPHSALAIPHSPLFPVAQTVIAARLRQACAALGLVTMKAHGFTRAYYVRVRRSQGAEDATIAVELGQSSNGDLIRKVYGDPGDGVGGNLYDWLPNDGQPVAWEILRQATPAQILPVKFG